MPQSESKKSIRSQEEDGKPLSPEEQQELQKLAERAERQGLKPFKSFSPDEGGKRLDTKLINEDMLAKTPEGKVDERILNPETLHHGQTLAGVLNALKGEGEEDKVLRTDSGEVGPYVEGLLNSVGDLSKEKSDEVGK